MRESHEAAHRDSLQKAASIKLEYSEILSAIMKSMKENYQVRLSALIELTVQILDSTDYFLGTTG